MGSTKSKKWKKIVNEEMINHPSRYDISVIFNTKTRDEATILEAIIHKFLNIDKNTLYWNEVKANAYFDTSGMKSYQMLNGDYTMCKVEDAKDEWILRGHKLGKNYGIVGESHPNFGKVYTPEEKLCFGSPKEKHPLWGKHHTDESKQKISESNIGRKCSDDFKKKCSIRQNGENNIMFGKHHTEESIEKMKTSISKIPKQKCIYCGLETTPGNIKRWHNKNCKLNDSFWEEW